MRALLVALALSGCVTTHRLSPHELPVPVVIQTGVMSCGLAALAAVLQYYGLGVGELELAQLMNTSGPISDADIVRTVALYYPTVEAIRTSGSLRLLCGQLELGRPVIAAEPGLLAEAHWVVVLACDGDVVVVSDPMNGKAAVPVLEFDEEWAEVGRVMVVVAPRRVQ